MNYPTWSDLNSESIVPPLGARTAPDIGPVAVMVSTEPDLRIMRSLVEIKNQGPFFMGSLLKLKSGVSIAGPYIGAPYATMILESLIAKGVRYILVLGWCGALIREHATGSLIIPDKAICDEGTSRNYKSLDPVIPCAYPDEAFSKKFADTPVLKNLKVTRCPIWTTDAIYRETPEKVAWYKEKGAHAVEMECSALFAAAQYRKVSIAGLLVVSDSLATKDWNPGFRKKTFKQARKAACESILLFAEDLNRSHTDGGLRNEYHP